MLWDCILVLSIHINEMKYIKMKWYYLLFYSEVSDRIEEYISSMMYQSETRSWICSECGKESKLKTDITRHVEAKHITNHPGYRCNYCGEYSKTKNALRVHISTRHPFKWEKMFILCIRINKLLWLSYFPYTKYFLYLDVSDTIEEHISSMMYQSETRSWICSVCGKESKLKTDITRHVEAKHITNHPGYHCNLCGEGVKTKNALRIHMSVRHSSSILM